MQWFFIALAAPLIWAVVNHIDKYVISRYAENKKPEALVIFSSLTAGLAAVLISIFAPIQNLSILNILVVAFAGVIFVASYIPYMYALKEDEVSIVAPLWQMIAPISYVLGAVFLREYLPLKQVLAGLLIVAGAVLMTIDFKKFVWKGRIFKLMFLSSFLLASNTLIFKIIGLESSFWTVSLWEYVGAFVFGIVLLCFSSYRADFGSFLKEGGKKIVFLNILAESINVIARLFFNFAALVAPIVLVYVLNGTQPLFIFLYGLILFFFFPKIEAENFSKTHFMLKLLAIIIMILGSTLLFL